MGHVYAVGVGPGSPDYLTGEARRVIRDCDLVIGHRYTLETIRDITKDKKRVTVTMRDQEAAYLEAAKSLGDGTLVVPFTGDVSYSESEVVDRLIEIFRDVELVPGVSAVQVAAARSRVPLDKSRVITMHVTSPIEEKKLEMLRALMDGYSVILIPRPWPGDPERHFMPPQVARYLAKRGIDTASLRVFVYENLTTPEERVFSGMVAGLEDKEFSDMCVMVFDQSDSDSYINYRWQWED